MTKSRVTAASREPQSDGIVRRVVDSAMALACGVKAGRANKALHAEFASALSSVGPGDMESVERALKDRIEAHRANRPSPRVHARQEAALRSCLRALTQRINALARAESA